ncbi:hypothetical protein NLJ89_g8289 [Agrocybe chaxingu]|uniref:Mid2 domain-containing protein n=1 Tax=Agrocybe chaxingu TaxID=84603 RepID=A0A9W8K220_9AGAR|nr:hypothetical protein NLJ89_g8289 [Agrocybe chaxingu]
MKPLKSVLFTSLLFSVFALPVVASLQNRQLPPIGQQSSTESASSSSTTSESSTSTTTSETSQLIPKLPPRSHSPVTVIDGVQTTVTVTGSATVTSSSETATATNTNEEEEDSGLSTGSIIGMSVAGGVAVIGIIAFFVWKFTRKRFADFDDNEAIKWPDLNSHSGAGDSHPLPVKSTGRSGFDTGSDGSLSRVPSNNYSTADVASSAVDPMGGW